jgi:hypothetical protein
MQETSHVDRGYDQLSNRTVTVKAKFVMAAVLASFAAHLLCKC